MNAIASNLARRRSVEFAAELIGRELVSFEEALEAFLVAANDPPVGSAKRCGVAWALRDEVGAWLRAYDYATTRALIASRRAIEGGEDRAEPIFVAAIAAADDIMPRSHTRESLAPLLREEWLRIRARPLSPIRRRRA
jgi:hypothetical protein